MSGSRRKPGPLGPFVDGYRACSTQQYIHADMTIKERALALLTPPTATPGRYRATDQVLAYLDSLR
jgi:hypothetical protein